MRIQDQNGVALETLEDWQALHKPRHWKRGRSAYEVANLIVNRNGADKLAGRVSQVLGDRVQFEQITAECEVRFDRYGKGRVHDLGIRGATWSGKSLFVGVEAKVDERFGSTVAEEWQKAQQTIERGECTRLPDRILELCGRFQGGPGISKTDDIRYQLMHGTAGTVAADADVSVFYVAVFVTGDYDPMKGEDNHNDYMKFIRRAGGIATAHNVSGATCHTLRLSGKRLTAIYQYIREGD